MRGRAPVGFSETCGSLAFVRRERLLTLTNFFSHSKMRTWATCQKIGAILEWATFHNVGCRTIAAFIAVRRSGVIDFRI